MSKAGNRCGILLFVLFAVVLFRPDVAQAAAIETGSETGATATGSRTNAVTATDSQLVDFSGSDGSSVAAASCTFLDAMTETEEVDVYDYEALEEVIESSVSLTSSSSDVEERRAWLKEAMEEALLTFTEVLDVSGHGITEEDLTVVAVSLVNADYRFCYVDSVYSYSRSTSTGIVSKVYFTYTAEPEEAIQMLAELEAAIDEVASSADDSWSDMEKALFINDYLCRTCEYDTAESGEDHTAYGALVEHCTVCEGYAKAFYAIGQRMGLNCGVVVSVDLGHEWSYVQVGDSYYYVDVTWDDPTTDRLGQAKHTYFLKSNSYFHSEDGGHTTDDWIYAGCDTNDDDDAGDTADAEDIADADDADDTEDLEDTESSDDSDEDDTELSEEDFSDTSYDDYFWNDITQGFEYIDGYWYTVNSRDIEAYVCDGTSFEYEETVLTVSDKWYVWDSTTSYYTSGYSGIASYDGLLYYSTPTEVWAYDVSAASGMDDSDTEEDSDGTETDDSGTDTGATYWVAYTLSDDYAELGYIYGIRVLDGALDIRLSTKLDASGTVGNYTVLELDTESKKDIADCSILVDNSAVFYDGTALLPEVTITDGTYTLVEGQDYAIASLDNITPGDKTLYVAGMGSYMGTAAGTFTISKASQAIEVTVSGTSITYGDTMTIAASTDGDGTLSYSSDDTSVATVRGSGETAVITAVGTGTAVITISASETDHYNASAATLEITVVPASQTLTASAGSTSIVYGKTTTITASTTGDGTLSYSSNNASVAAVSSSGKVTAKGAGTATITVIASATDNYKAATATVTITVTRASQTLAVSSSSVSLAVGKTSTPTVSGAKTTLSYSSSDTSVATVSSSGKITAKAVGTATITVTAKQTVCYSKATKTIKVTVKPAATTISSVKNTSSGVKITWKKVTGATGYYVYRATSSSGTYTKIATERAAPP